MTSTSSLRMSTQYSAIIQYRKICYVMERKPTEIPQKRKAQHAQEEQNAFRNPAPSQKVNTALRREYCRPLRGSCTSACIARPGGSKKSRVNTNRNRGRRGKRTRETMTSTVPKTQHACGHIHRNVSKQRSGPVPKGYRT
jgi:hypothetical protein